MGKLIRPDNTKNIVQKNMNKDDHEQCLTESTSSHNTFPWKCSRTRRQGICEIREEMFERNGMTLKCFRKHLIAKETN